jgi:hypothetical protein
MCRKGGGRREGGGGEEKKREEKEEEKEGKKEKRKKGKKKVQFRKSSLSRIEEKICAIRFGPNSCFRPKYWPSEQKMFACAFPHRHGFFFYNTTKMPQQKNK